MAISPDQSAKHSSKDGYHGSTAWPTDPLDEKGNPFSMERLAKEVYEKVTGHHSHEAVAEFIVLLWKIADVEHTAKFDKAHMELDILSQQSDTFDKTIRSIEFARDKCQTVTGR